MHELPVTQSILEISLRHARQAGAQKICDLYLVIGQLASIVLPEFVPAHWWQNLLHNQTAALMRLALLYDRRRMGTIRAIINIPFQLKK